MTEKKENNKTLYSSGSPFEPLRGFSRAVKVGNALYISGTTSMTPNNDVIGIGDPYLQTKTALETIKSVLQEAGFELEDVVRTRLAVTDISKWNDYAKAHRKFFGDIRPASSIFEVKRLVDSRLMVEIEVDAVK